jgi:hypothetical protein
MARQALNKILGFRCLLVMVMFFFTLDMFLRPLREYAVANREATSPSVLAFLIAHNYFQKMILLAVIYFYSNVPFLEKQEQYYFQRLGRRRFCIRGFFYILISGFWLSAALWGLSLLDMAPCVRFTRSWDRLSKTLALTSAGTELQLHFGIFYRAIENFTPLELCLYSFVTLALCCSMVGMLMYAFCLLFHRVAAVSAASVVAMLPDIMTRPRAWTYPVYLSPVSWVGCDSWRSGYDVEKPDFVYIFVAYGFLLFLFGALSLWRSKRIEYTG